MSDKEPTDQIEDTLTTIEPVASDKKTEQVVEPAQTATPSQKQTNSAGVVILQWLTYAFWGWLIIGLIWVISVILINAILGTSVSEVVPYAVAATIVLLPLAFVCDLFYRKYEPVKKTGAAMVILVIHAVLFALIGIGTLIVSVFTGLNMAINVGEGLDNQLVLLLVTAFATVLYAGAFVRTLNPFKSKKAPLVYAFTMLGVSILLLILAVVGPIVQSVASRDDRRIEAGLSGVQRDIETYVVTNNKLPDSLQDVEFSERSSQDIVDDNLVEYKAVGKIETLSYPSTSASYRYELCVTYKLANNPNDYSSNRNNQYQSYLSTYSHDAGRVCYKLEQAAPTVTIQSSGPELQYENFEQ